MLPDVLLQQTSGDDCNIMGGDGFSICAEDLQLEEFIQMQGCCTLASQECRKLPRMNYAQKIQNAHEIQMGVGFACLQSAVDCINAVCTRQDIYTPTDMHGTNKTECMQISNDIMSTAPPSAIALPPVPLNLHPLPLEEVMKGKVKPNQQHVDTQQLLEWQNKPAQVSLYIYFAVMGVFVLHNPNPKW
jgi:hypothetical protein